MSMEISKEYWRLCSSCKKPIFYNTSYYVCSVSTCNRKRTGLVFCCVSCWERHLPSARHRDAAAISETSPSYEEWLQELQENPTEKEAAMDNSSGQRRIVKNNSVSSVTSQPQVTQEVLIVTSKLKAFIRAVSDMNTSNNVVDILSDKVRRMCLEAIDNARAEGRKTVLDRDFK